MMIIIIIIILQELFYNRNPGDARVKVGSERKFAARRLRPCRGVAEILDFKPLVRPRGPSRIGPGIREEDVFKTFVYEPRVSFFKKSWFQSRPTSSRTGLFYLCGRSKESASPSPRRSRQREANGRSKSMAFKKDSSRKEGS